MKNVMLLAALILPCPQDTLRLLKKMNNNENSAVVNKCMQIRESIFFSTRFPCQFLARVKAYDIRKSITPIYKMRKSLLRKILCNYARIESNYAHVKF